MDQALHQEFYVHYLIWYLSLPSWENNSMQSLLSGVSSGENKAEEYDGVKHKRVEIRRTQNPPCYYY